MSGGSAPSTPTDGTRLVLGSDLPSGYVDSVAGTNSYSVFVAYDEKGDPPATEMRFSAAVSVTGVSS